MANVITRRVRLSRRIFLKGLTATQAPVVLGLPPLVSMFNSDRDRLCGGDHEQSRAGREAVRALVQRQRHSGALLDSRRDRAPTTT